MAVKTILQKLTESQQKLNIEARESIVKGIAELLPEGAKLEWDQYTQYFNDGEPCDFDVYSPTLHINGEGVRIGWGGASRYAGVCPEALFTEIHEAWKNIPSNLFLVAFGDHVSITVTSAGEVEVSPNEDHD